MCNRNFAGFPTSGMWICAVNTRNHTTRPRLTHVNFMATSLNPFCSKRSMIFPTSPLWTPSGLTMIKVRSWLAIVTTRSDINANSAKIEMKNIASWRNVLAEMLCSVILMLLTLERDVIWLSNHTFWLAKSNLLLFGLSCRSKRTVLDGCRWTK